MASEVLYSICTIDYGTFDHQTFNSALQEFVYNGPVEKWDGAFVYGPGARAFGDRLKDWIIKFPDISKVISEEMNRRKQVVNWAENGF